MKLNHKRRTLILIETFYCQKTDNRKFEIELFWKRATYFWVFISLIFIGYFTVSSNKEFVYVDLFKVLISYTGIVFSTSWYLVNRGSKFWQKNWELHVDYLEDEVIGPLYKLMIDNRNCVCQPLKDYPFSVSRINILISLYVTLIWMFISVMSIIQYFNSSFQDTLAYFIAMSLVNLFVIYQLLFKMKSSGRVGRDTFMRRDRC